MAAQDGSTILLGTYKDLMDLVIKDFSPYDAPKDAIYEMKEMKMEIHQLKNMLPSLLMHSPAQFCTVCLLMHSLLRHSLVTQYIRTG